SKAVLHPAGKVEPLLYHDERIGACPPDLLQLLHHKGYVACGRVLHGVVVVLEAAGAFERILRVLAQRLSELVLAQRVRFTALGGVYAAVVGHVRRESDRRRAVHPTVAGGRGEDRVITPPRPPRFQWPASQAADWRNPRP